MKLKIYSLKSRLGEMRTIEKFLWFPKVLDGEIRWFEKTKIIQRVCKVQDSISNSYQWINITWATKTY